MKLFLIILLILIIIIWVLTRKNPADDIYLHISGSPQTDKRIFQEYKDNLKYKSEITALDLYRLGSLYDFVNDVKPNKMTHINPEKAGKYYLRSLEKISERPHKLTADERYIVEKIKDRLKLNKLYVALLSQNQNIEERPLYPTHVIGINRDLETLRNINNNFTQPQIIQPGFAQPQITQPQITQPDDKKELINWVSDSQNVHDSNINSEVKQQYDFISRNIVSSQWNISDIIQYISKPEIAENMLPFERNNIIHAKKMLAYIGRHDPHINILSVNESEYVGKIFTYIMREQDANKQKIMIENFIANLKDMNPDSPVCINGRITRMLSSVAKPEESELGVLKSGQVIQNEIFAKIGHIRDSIMNDADAETVKAYNAGKENKQTSALKLQIMKEIDRKVLADYSNAKGIDLAQIRTDIFDNL